MPYQSRRLLMRGMCSYGTVLWALLCIHFNVEAVLFVKRENTETFKIFFTRLCTNGMSADLFCSSPFPLTEPAPGNNLRFAMKRSSFLSTYTGWQWVWIVSFFSFWLLLINLSGNLRFVGNQGNLESALFNFEVVTSLLRYMAPHFP